MATPKYVRLTLSEQLYQKLKKMAGHYPLATWITVELIKMTERQDNENLYGSE